MRCGQIVLGPAGSGKSSYCYFLQQHCEAKGRRVYVVNLDPAAEHFKYTVDLDIRDLITLDDVADATHLGPNGGLVFCMEYLIANIEWLHDELDTLHEDDYVILDCPGQIELYTHYPVMTKLINQMKLWNFNMCGVYLIDSTFCQDTTKFMSAALTAMSTMVMLEIPHLNVLSKCDLWPEWQERQSLDKFSEMDITSLVEDMRHDAPKRFQQLTQTIATLLEEWNMVSLVPLDPDDEETIEMLLLQIDTAIQFGEDADVQVKEFGEGEEEENSGE